MMAKSVCSAAYERHVIQQGWSQQYADDQRGWFQHHEKVTPEELDAYCLGVKAGYGKAIADLCMHGLIRKDRVSGV